MTVLITGAGIIGSLTARALVEQGQACLLLDTNPQEEAIRSILGTAEVPIVRGDILDVALLTSLLDSHNVDAIVHTAAVLSFAIVQQPHRGVEVNLMGTMNVLEAARLRGLRRVVLASSTTVAYPAFGAGETGPLAEDVPLRTVSQRPMSLYAATKLTGEYLMLLYVAQFGIDAVALRYAAVLGDWTGPNNSIPGTLLRTFGDAVRHRRPAVFTEPRLAWVGGEEFIDARDCAAANVAALAARDPRQRVYTIASGKLCTFADLVAAAKALYPDLAVELTFEPKRGFAGSPVIRKFPSDIGAAERELGFRPRHDFAESCATYMR
jgi:UDP-glucose 4-epimerase